MLNLWRISWAAIKRHPLGQLERLGCRVVKATETVTLLAHTSDSATAELVALTVHRGTSSPCF